jgi:hypothetical protein
MSEDDAALIGAVAGFAGCLLLLLVGLGFYWVSRPDPQADRVGAAIKTSVEKVLKGRPLTVEEVDAFASGETTYILGLKVQQTGEVMSRHYEANATQVCEEEKAECWHIDSVWDGHSIGDKNWINIAIYGPLPPGMKTLETHQSIETGSIGSPSSSAGVGG